MPNKYHARPGGNALNPTFTPVATSSGALDLTGVSDTNLVTPNQSFAYAMPDGSTKSFYLNMPVVVSPGVKAALLAAGLVS